MLNLLRSNSTSLFRISLLLLTAFAVRNWYFNALLILYLLLRRKESIVLFIALLTIIMSLEYIMTDFVPVGIVEYRKGNYYVVDRMLYKTKINTDSGCYPGDILLFDSNHVVNTSESDLKYNIRYTEDSCEKIGELTLRRVINERIESFEPATRSRLYGFLYNSYSSEKAYSDLTYGLASYYLLKRIRKRSSFLGLISVFSLCLCFSVQIKYVFILIDIVCERLDLDRYCRTSLYIISVLFINVSLLTNYSIIIPIMISMFSLFETGIDFRNFFMIIQSLLFGEIDLSGFFFPVFIGFRIVLFLFSVVLLIFPSLDQLYLQTVSLYAMIDGLDLAVRGSPSLHTVLVFILFMIMFRPEGNWITALMIIILILNPLNRPFAHVSFIDVGQGDAIMIRDTMKYSCILIDTGSIYNYYKLRKQLYSEGIYAIDHLIITHDDSDHNGNIELLQEDFRVKEIITDGRDIDYGDLKLRYYDLGIFDNDNDSSLVYGLDIVGFEFLFTGDIGKDAERVFVQRYGPYDADVLKVAHHGSHTSTSAYFIGSILPEYAVISTSGQYSHPHEEVLDTLNRYSVRYFNTRYDKTVSFYFTRYLCFIHTGNNEFVIIS